MKTRIILSLAVLACGLAGGCLQMATRTTINKDGSGAASLTLSISPVLSEAMTEMKAMGPAFGQQTELPDFSEITRAGLEKQAAGHGVKITKFEKGLVDGRETLNYGLEFKDLKGLSYVMGATLGQATSGGLGIVPTGDGNFRLQSVDYGFVFPESAADDSDAQSEEDPAAMDPAAMQQQMELMAKVMGALNELRISMEITVPGEIISSNAHRVEGRTSIWELTPENVMTSADGLEPDIVFSGKGLKLE